jgi:hypothetical protein
MKSSLRATLVSLATLLTLAIAITPTAQAVYLELDGGYFRPWDPGTFTPPPVPFLNPNINDTGWYVAGAVMGGTASGKARFGGQVEYQNYTANGPSIDIIGLTKPAVRWDSWLLRFLFQYNFMPDSLIQPYIGAHFGFSVNRFDDSIYQALSGGGGGGITIIDLQNIGVGIDFAGLAGVAIQIPGAEWMQLYGQAKFGYHAVFATTITNIGGIDNLEVLNLGGINAGGGIRFRF